MTDIQLIIATKYSSVRSPPAGISAEGGQVWLKIKNGRLFTDRPYVISYSFLS